MKKLLVLAAFVCTLQCLTAQTTGRLESRRDAWGSSYDYVGEIKNKQPNGLGIAIYSNDNTLRYSGYFLNGMYNGKGVMLFKNGSFLSGEWKNGKLDGKGASLSGNGDLYVGEFADGKRNGSGTYTYDDKSFLIGKFKNDNFDGRCIFVSTTGKTVSDNIYTDGKKNGDGYQYEVDSKTLYEGIWKDGTWQNSAPASFISFLKSANFYGEKTENQVLIGGIDKANNNVLQDTGFYYNIKTNNRTFGYNEKGYLANGITIKDSTRFFGKINDNGAYGSCSFYKAKHFFDEGTYAADNLEGSDVRSIDLQKLTVYMGGAAKGTFTGKGWFSNSYNELYVGNFDNGQFTGTGYIVFNNGKKLSGSFKDGVPQNVTAFTDENGAAITLKPKTFSEALSTVTSEFSNNYQAFKLDDADSTEYSFDDYIYTYNSVISFPKATGKDVILEDYDFNLMYNVAFYKGSDYNQAAAKYNELCKELAAASLHLRYSAAPITLSGTLETPVENETTRTEYTLNNYSSLSRYSIYAELLYKDGNYKVNLVAGDVKFDD